MMILPLKNDDLWQWYPAEFTAAATERGQLVRPYLLRSIYIGTHRYLQFTPCFGSIFPICIDRSRYGRLDPSAVCSPRCWPAADNTQRSKLQLHFQSSSAPVCIGENGDATRRGGRGGAPVDEDCRAQVICLVPCGLHEHLVAVQGAVVDAWLGTAGSVWGCFPRK